MKGVGNSNFYLSWGKVLKNMGKCNESAEKYKKALELVPKELGKAKEAVEKEAKNSFEKCIEK